MGAYAGIAIAATILLYALYYAVVVSSLFDGLRDTIAGVVVKRIAGVIILGGGSALATWLFLPFGLADLGLTPTIPPVTWVWVGGVSVAIVIGCIATAHRPENFEVYPEMRVPRWGVGPVAANLVSCSIYMFAYEFLFRGFLLFACLAAMPAVWAIAINVLLYALAHVPKGPREALGSIPLGVVVCLATIDTGSIWAAFLIHAIMSQLNDYLAVRANPGMRFAFRTSPP